jgi:hypothetical protein
LTFLFISLSVFLLIMFISTFVFLSDPLILEYSLCSTLYIIESFFMFLGQSSTIWAFWTILSQSNVFVTIIANLAERTSWPNCQACSGRRAGNWRGHSRKSIYSDKRRDCER